MAHGPHTAHGSAGVEGDADRAFPIAPDDERFRLLFERNPQPMWVYDRQSLRFLAVNDRACLHYGYSRDEFFAMRIDDIRPAEELPRLEHALSTPQRSLRVSEGWRHRRKDGSVIVVEIASHALPFAGRDAILVVATDVTERARADEALRRSELRYRRLVETALEGIWEVDVEDRTSFVNGAMAAMLGYAPEDMLGRPLIEFYPEEDRPAALARFRQRREGITSRSVVRLLHRNGSILWVSTSVNPLFDDGVYLGNFALLTDITDRLRAEEEARIRERAIAAAELAVVIADAMQPDQPIIYANAAVETITGYAQEAILGGNMRLLQGPDSDPDTVATVRAAVAEGHDCTVVLRNRRADGRPFWNRLAIAPVHDEGGRLTHFVGILNDVSEEVETRQATEQARQAAVDLAQMRSDFVAAVTHELRTPLTSILGYVELLQSRWEQLAEAQRRGYVDRMAQAVMRQLRLVDDLLLLSQIQGGAFSVQCLSVPLAGLVRSAAEEVAGSYAGQHIALDGSEDVAVLADPARVIQVVVNVLDNAAKYSAEAMPVYVAWRVEGDIAVVRVRDRGPGIPEAGRSHLFTRFGRVPESRMREGRVGTGLGLYLGRQLAEAMGGTLDLEESGSTGSVFRLRLPLAPDSRQGDAAVP